MWNFSQFHQKEISGHSERTWRALRGYSKSTQRALREHSEGTKRALRKRYDSNQGNWGMELDLTIEDS